MDFMTEIPADVLKAAHETMAAWWTTKEGLDAFGTRVPQTLPDYIARAIMAATDAERERCGKVAEAAEDESSKGAQVYDSGAGECGWRYACTHIAAAIGQPPE